jgi:TM2 domain-containing membrane protein YozV
MADAEWYYVGHYGQLGPLTLDQMMELVQDGVIDADTYVWRPSMSDWLRAAGVPQLAPHLVSGSIYSDVPVATPPPLPSARLQTTLTPSVQNLGTTSLYGPTNWSMLEAQMPKSDKSRIVAGLLNFIPGVGRIYLGYMVHGFLQMFLAFACGIGWPWSIIDGIVMLCGGVKYDGYGRKLDD